MEVARLTKINNIIWKFSFLRRSMKSKLLRRMKAKIISERSWVMICIFSPAFWTLKLLRNSFWFYPEDCMFVEVESEFDSIWWSLMVVTGYSMSPWVPSIWMFWRGWFCGEWVLYSKFNGFWFVVALGMTVFNWFDIF